MSANSPNELAGALLTRIITPEGEVWKVQVWVTPQAGPPLKAVTALKSGIIQAATKVIKGELDTSGNGEHTLSLNIRPVEAPV